MIYTAPVLVQDKMRANAFTVLLIVGQEPFEQLLAYFRAQCLSRSQERTYAQAAGRFIQWLSVRADEFKETRNRTALYTAFVHDLKYGTYHKGIDESGLYWRPTSHGNLNRLTRALLAFCDWLSVHYGLTMLNPIHHHASPADQLIFWRKWNKQKATSLLRHIKSRQAAGDEAEIGRSAGNPRNRNGVIPESKAFPEQYVNDLIWQGFINPGKRKDPRMWVKFNLRDILIALLCAYGGCRASEPLHLWVDDVFVDPDDPELALVFIHEPSEGIAEYINHVTGSKRKTTRADFLQRFCSGRRPLTQEAGRRNSGWKGCLLTEHKRKAFRVFWVDKNAGRVFLTLWREYIENVRPVTPQIPWAFLTKDSQPLGFEGYDDSFRAAVRRIGLVPDKWAGTTSQGLRHLYGQFLNKLNIDAKEGQVAMHHLSIESQEVYRQLSAAHVAAAVGKLDVMKCPIQWSKK